MSTPKISISTELMKNYKQAELMSPEQKFEALQTVKGNSLLFSIGTDNVFYLTEEITGHSTGWEKTNMSTAQLAKSFPGQTGLTCKTFEAAQNVVDGTIGLGMVVNDGKNDHLFLCLGNSNSDTSWKTEPSWVSYPFDNPAKAVTIAGVFISETSDSKQFIVVDILRDPKSAEKLISRYYIETKSSPAWQPHDVSIDLEAGSYSSCLGRQYLPGSTHQPTIDGLYTTGQVDGLPQFIFQPLYNVFDPDIPAAPVRLKLPGGLIADSIASCRKTDMSSDLYACSNGGLYYFASGNQADGAMGILVSQNTMYDGVRKMYAGRSNDMVIVWGLNGSDEIFYTSCPAGRETASPSEWSYPLPIVTGVDMFTPYLNRADNGNTFFAVAGDTLRKLIKSPPNTTWTSQSVTLPSPDTADTQKYNSYTTRILVTDENNQPIANTPISISSDSRAPVYINYLYYVVSPEPLQVNTDELGSVTVIEWVNGLTGTKLSVSGGDGNTTVVNPMDKPLNKIASLDTADGLKNAKITNDDGSTTPLVDASVAENDLNTVAAANVALGTAYDSLSQSTSVMSAQMVTTVDMSMALTTNSSADAEAIVVDAGDLFSWLESGVEASIQIVEDTASKTWHCVAKIAGQSYACVLDAVEKVVAAAVWVFNTIRTAIEDLISFLEFLFAWPDILITHRVMKNVFTQLVRETIDEVGSLKSDLADAFTALQNEVNKWADIPAVNETPSDTLSANPPLDGQNSAPSQFGIHHYQGNASNSSSSFSTPPVNEEIFTDLLNLLDSEEATLSAACNAIKTDIIDQFDTLTVTEIAQRFVAIVNDTLLQTVENILLAAIDVFVQLAAGMLDLLTATVDIPVLTSFYKELTGDDLSLLDLFCLIAAIPATLVYKNEHDKAPFSENDSFTEGLLNAGSFDEVRAQFYSSQTVIKTASVDMSLAAEDDAKVINDDHLKVFGFVTGFFAFAGSIGLIVVTASQRGSTVGSPKTLATLGAFANISYVSPNIATLINIETDNWYQQLNNTLTAVSILKGFANIWIAGLTDANAASKISSYIESTINIVWNVPVIANLIVNYDERYSTYKSLIPESTGNFAFNYAGTLDFPITEGDTDAIPVQYALMGVYGALMAVSGGIVEFAH